jgi:outer membrane protein OmpA-like peptidoglycan-associated protein
MGCDTSVPECDEAKFMQFRLRPVLLASAAALTVTACTDPAMVGTPQPYGPQYNRTQQGAALGAVIGGLAGATQGDDANDRRQNAAVGALAGAAIGGVGGNILDRQAAELRGGFSSPQISVVNTGSELLVRMPQEILFATDSASVAPAMQRDLVALAENLGRYQNSNVEIIGHTDNTGTAAYNQDLSERRARAAASVLTGYGVPSSRLSAIGRGEDSPIASNLTPEGRAQNRRVDIVIRPY